MKKILITTGLYPPEIGGPATYSKLLMDELPKRGYKVEVLSFSEVRHLPKLIRHISFFIKVLRLGRGFDIIYTQDPVSVGFPTMLVARTLNIPFFIRIAGDYAWEQGVQRFGVKDSLDEFSAQSSKYNFPVRFFKWIQKKVAQSANQIIVPSQYFKSVIINWGISPEKIKVIYNGIQIPENLVAKLPSDGEKMLLSVGRLVPWKGFKVLIEMMPELKREISNLKLKIVGDGPQRLELENLIRDLNLELEKDVILTGQLSREDLLKEKQKSLAFVFNTNWESFSFDTLEAMAMGLPVITTNVGSLPELIDDGESGILVTPNDKEALKNAIRKIINNFDFRDRIIQEAYLKSKNFSIQKTLDELEVLF